MKPENPVFITFLGVAASVAVAIFYGNIGNIFSQKEAVFPLQR